MSDYMLAPGARLEIGPGGKPYETLGTLEYPLGACCAGCANGVGDFSIGGMTIPTYAVVGAAGLAAWWLFFRKKHRRNPARRRRHARRRRYARRR